MKQRTTTRHAKDLGKEVPAKMRSYVTPVLAAMLAPVGGLTSTIAFDPEIDSARQTRELEEAIAAQKKTLKLLDDALAAKRVTQRQVEAPAQPVVQSMQLMKEAMQPVIEAAAPHMKEAMEPAKAALRNALGSLDLLKMRSNLHNLREEFDNLFARAYRQATRAPGESASMCRTESYAPGQAPKGTLLVSRTTAGGMTSSQTHSYTPGTEQAQQAEEASRKFLRADSSHCLSSELASDF